VARSYGRGSVGYSVSAGGAGKVRLGLPGVCWQPEAILSSGERLLR